MRKISILVIEDETAIRDMIRFSLPLTQFDMTEAENTKQAEELLAKQVADIIILDWMLPGKSGIDFIKWLKQHTIYKDIPIVMLTAKAEEESKIKGLESGADDYITKPFSPQELIARIKAILRRGPLISPGGIIKVGSLKLNVNTHEVSVETVILPLTPIEYRLLYFFMTHANRTYSRDQLITQVWGGNVYIEERTVDVQIRRLRDRLREHNYHNLIKTVRGAGYQLVGEVYETDG